MKKFTLRIDSPGGSQTVTLEKDEISIGRTDLSNVVLDDPGLSRKNTTFFIEDEELYVVDEGSLNGTFINGQRQSGAPRRLADGDEVTIGSGTSIRIVFGDGRPQPLPVQTPSLVAPAPAPAPKKTKAAASKASNKPPMIVMVAAGSVFVIVFLALAGLLAVSLLEGDRKNAQGKPTPMVLQSALIPVRVIDPLGGEDPDDLDDLIASWETAEEELNVATVADVKVTEGSDGSEAAELNVTAAFLAEQKNKAMAGRTKETGIRPAGLKVPRELFGDGVVKQKVKLAQMKSEGYQQPMDFADLAQKRLSGDLIEMPMATESFYLEVGGSAADTPITSFSFADGIQPIAPGTPKWDVISRLASNFAGQKYSLDNPADRKQMRMRLLRMFNKNAKPILKELADHYHARFNRPLRVTSLTRSMDYQILLNANNANSFKVRGEGSLPPHTSGCAFDLARKHMDVDEQNYLMEKLAEMERAGKLDALIEYGLNACFHIFIYRDGIAPRM